MTTGYPGNFHNFKTSPTQFYTWNNYRCAYEVHTPIDVENNQKIALLLIHPIGVGLSRHFWQRFYEKWYHLGRENLIYNPDLLGCGESSMPRLAYTPNDWAEQLQDFLLILRRPVILVVQGALFPVAIALIRKLSISHLIKGIILSGPPAWPVITKKAEHWQQKLTWNLLNSPLGNGFYRYARGEKFLRSFSTRQLFAEEEQVDTEWLNMLKLGSRNMASRYAVFAFLARFWQQGYEQAITKINQPTLVVLGEKISSISKSGTKETPIQRSQAYIKHLPKGETVFISGRNVLPYESTAEFVKVVADFVDKIESNILKT
ncbi:alpha/beta hydrolase [Phormidium sp. LEGE 05292]|uniref:alpha/beta fold hydrolase n=1 Tax=[Phormidium] sp. LEGE 05292 TaxID=767427 RepID=UPI001880CD7F|nr:alpha/beta hydrolase [Phormidium sp. LEGE 05292]MBE9229496.1 alpha/beta hydrolase [Phormidium sp. LEGE 05292]